MNCIEKLDLYHEVNEAILNSVSKLVKPHEPDYIANLTTNLPCHLKIILNKYFIGRKFSIGGCFIHQKPLAHFIHPTAPSIKSPEIGDLLLIYKEIRPSVTYYNALLLQAKVTSNLNNSRITNNDMHQLKLYTEWPIFEYKKAGSLNGKSINISPKTITNGAQYLLIETPFTEQCCSPFWCAMPDKILKSSSLFAMQIIKLIEFQTGRTFVDKAIAEDEWSKMIWDLLDISASSSFNRKRSGYEKEHRFTGDKIIELLLANKDEENINGGDFSGISVICIESSSD